MGAKAPIELTGDSTSSSEEEEEEEEEEAEAEPVPTAQTVEEQVRIRHPRACEAQPKR